MPERTVLIEVYDDLDRLTHNALCRTLSDIAAASQRQKFRLIPPANKAVAKEWEQVYDSYENQVALGRAE